MNKLCLLFINLILAVSLNAQAPQAFKYQAIARNNSAQVLVEKPIALRITILKDNSNGQSVYQETWKVTTNKLGLFNLDIGNGIPVLGSGPFSEILWGESIHFLKIEIDETGLGNNFSLMGISQLLSVPYSLYSEKSGSIEKITGENTQLIYNDNNKPAGASGFRYDKNYGNVVIGSSVTDASAILELNSLNKGFLPPRMTSEQMNSIVNPTEGLTIYNTTVQALCFYNTTWNCLDKQSLQNLNFICNNNFTDQRDNQVYKTVLIGNQCWMKQNLNAITYQNGDIIPNITDNIEWSNFTNGAYCYYENNSDTRSIYGLLYNWKAASDNRNICPIGWHLPSDIEWNTLISFLGNEFEAGNKLRETDTTHWKSPNSDATNESGFTALPGGSRQNWNGEFVNLGYNCNLWLSTETLQNYALSINIIFDSPIIIKNENNINNGFSVRCIKNE